MAKYSLGTWDGSGGGEGVACCRSAASKSRLGSAGGGGGLDTVTDFFKASKAFFATLKQLKSMMMEFHELFRVLHQYSLSLAPETPLNVILIPDATDES